MKKFILLYLIILPFLAKAQDNPIALPSRSDGYVNDYTGSLSDSAEMKLEAKLKAFDKPDNGQIVIAIIKTVGNEDMTVFGTRLANSWGAGYKGKNNGVLVLIAMNDHNSA